MVGSSSAPSVASSGEQSLGGTGSAVHFRTGPDIAVWSPYVPFFDSDRPDRLPPVTDLPAPRISDLARARAPQEGEARDYLSGLNPEQREAVETTEGPVLVLAGAGTGKTRVLTTRLAHILATGRARPWELLAVTFTNKAAREMRERITHLIGPSAEGLRWLGTFHSIAAQILRRHAELVGLKSSFTILDTDDQERLLKQRLVQ